VLSKWTPSKPELRLIAPALFMVPVSDRLVPSLTRTLEPAVIATAVPAPLISAPLALVWIGTREVLDYFRAPARVEVYSGGLRMVGGETTDVPWRCIGWPKVRTAPNDNRRTVSVRVPISGQRTVRLRVSAYRREDLQAIGRACEAGRRGLPRAAEQSRQAADRRSRSVGR